MMGLPCPLGRGRCVARNASRESLNRAALCFRLFGSALPPPLPLLRSPHFAAAEAHEMFEMEDCSLEGGKQFARIAASDKRGHNEERGGAQKAALHATTMHPSPIGAPLPCRVGLTTAGSRRGGIIVV